MRIGITGGNGFIGGYVVEECLTRGYQVTVFDRADRHLPGRPADVFLGDVRDPVAMAELAAHVDGIIHLAACLGTQETILNPRPAAETNITGGLNFLEACAQYRIPGAYIAVGNHWMNNSYSITKTTVERFCDMFNTERGGRVNTVRVVNAYGPRQSVAPPYGSAKVRKITPAFVCRALAGDPIEVYGDGQQVSDMVSVKDAARALVTALDKAAADIVFDRPVEVGPAVHNTVLDVAQTVIGAVQGLGHPPVEIKHLPMRPGEIPGARVIADTETLTYVDMTPEQLIPLEKGIAETVTWYAEHWLPSYPAQV